MSSRREALRRGLHLAGAGALAPWLGGCAPALIATPPRDDGTDRFGLGVASGSPRPDGMVLWTRLVGPALPERVDVAWEVAHDEAFTRIAARGTEAAVADEAHSVHAEPAGLAPDRPWFFRFAALGQRSATGRTRTAPEPDAPVARLRFAIASCQRWDAGHYAAWRDVAAAAPDLIVFLGDYIYEYATVHANWVVRPQPGPEARTLAQYRERYAQYRRDPHLQAAHAAAPWLPIWDDHEVVNDHAGLSPGRPDPDFARRRGDAYRAWWEHMPVPRAMKPVDLAAGGRLPLHRRLEWGRLARWHLLDTRQFRDVQACPPPGRGGSAVVPARGCAALFDPARSVLGAAQERWFFEGLDTAAAAAGRWNLVAQTTLIAPLPRRPAIAPGDPGGGSADLQVWTDGWDGYAPARRRLLGALRERRVANPVVLGGDLHMHLVADLHAEPEDPRSPVVASEFVGSSISSRGVPQIALDSVVHDLPHVRHARSVRGAVLFELTPSGLAADLRAVADVRDPASAVTSAARFVVEAGRPGAQRA